MSSLTRQHFQAIADGIASAGLDQAARWAVARSIAAELARFNDRFDRERFLTAALRTP
jgi:hypothetical protein